MPISFNKEKKLFHLYNKDISYYFYINSKNILQHLYFGKYLDDIDIFTITKLDNVWGNTYLDKLDLKEKNYQDNYYYDESLVEVSTYGLGDIRPSTYNISDSFNNKVDFRYVSHKVIKGVIKYDDQPHFLGNENDATTLEITLKDVFKDIYLIISYTIYNNYNVILRNTKIINKEIDKISISKASSITLDLASSDYNLIYFPGDWAFEREFRKEKINEGTKVLRSKFGKSSHEINPFIILENNESKDEYIGVSFVYSGSFVYEINVNKYHSTRVNLGILDEDLNILLNKDEELILPQGMLTYSFNGLDNLTHTLHDVIRDKLITINNKEVKEAILLNSWEGCFMDFDTKKMVSYIKEAKDIGINMFVLDDGWFSTRNDDIHGLGDWDINTKKIDLNEVIKVCKENNLKFGLWFEPEMINLDTKLFKEHPDYIIGDYKNYDLALSRHQLVLDFSKDEVVMNIFNQMKKILDNYEIDYIKWDHNRNIFDAYSNKSKDQGNLYFKYTLGYYKLLSLIRKHYPNILIEGCASGGGRFDLGTLFYTPQIWCSDETDPIQRLFIEYSTSIIYPLTTMGAHISKNPITNYKTKGNIALFGTYGFEFDPRTLTDSQKEEIKEVNDIFNKYHKEVISDGDLYHLLSPYDSNYCVMMSVSKNKSKALVLFNNLLKRRNTFRFIKLKGLDENKYYYNNYDNSVHKGSYYLNVGINLTRWFDEFANLLIIITEVNK